MTGILPTVIAEQLSASFPKVVIGNPLFCLSCRHFCTLYAAGTEISRCRHFGLQVVPEGCNRESCHS